MRKFKVECLFDSFGGEDTHWQNDETVMISSSTRIEIIRG
jgi:hypothetical protein